MNLRSGVWLLAAAWTFPVCAQDPDPAFNGIHLEDWLNESGQGPFHWSARISSPELSPHQRLHVRVEVTVDGNDLVARRGHGALVMLIQFEDSDHRLYQSHGTVGLENLNDATAKSNIIYVQDVLVRPGDYRAGLAIFDTLTQEHSAVRKAVHVGPLKNDPFPDSWRDLPPVEFASASNWPDDAFLPAITGRLQLPLETRSPLHLDVLVNASPTAAGPGARTGQVNNRSLAVLLPALKVITQIAIGNGTLNVGLVDLTRRSLVFEENAVTELDWPRLREALGGADPNKIDVGALRHREQNAQFFVEEVRRRVNGPEPRVLIVLSGPMGFESGEDTHAIELAAKNGAKVYFVRYHTLPPPAAQPQYADTLRPGRRGITSPLPGPAPRPVAIEPLDSLVALIKPLQPRVFDVYSPEQFRKALSQMMEEISKL